MDTETWRVIGFVGHCTLGLLLWWRLKRIHRTEVPWYAYILFWEYVLVLRVVVNEIIPGEEAKKINEAKRIK